MVAAPTITIDDFLGRLQNVRRHAGYWTARCPAHDDRRPSLKVKAGYAGVLAWCLGPGCTYQAILAAVGLKHGRLAAEPEGRRRVERVVAEYDYVDEAGEVLYQKVRLEPKDFRVRRPNASYSGWVWNLDQGTRRILYRLPDLLERPGELAFLCEGEKDADGVAALGLLATTNVEGAGPAKWKPALGYGAQLAGRPVAVCGDNDAAGRYWALDAAADLAAHGCRVRLVWVPGVKDVSDWLATVPAPLRRAGLLSLARSSPGWPEVRFAD